MNLSQLEIETVLKIHSKAPGNNQMILLLCRYHAYHVNNCIKSKHHMTTVIPQQKKVDHLCTLVCIKNIGISIGYLEIVWSILLRVKTKVGIHDICQHVSVLGLIGFKMNYGLLANIMPISCQYYANVLQMLCRYDYNIKLIFCCYHAYTMLISCRYYANILLPSCRYYADFMQILCRYYADIMPILCQCHADIMAILCRYYADNLSI